MLTTTTVLQLLPLAINAFGALSQAVLELRAAGGLTDDQLLSEAEARDAATLAAIQAHLSAIKADEAAAPPAPAA